ncbi:MAG: cytochrome c [Xanthomonadales bacterium]|nr:cytochrome c [Xanthomonadales bacterium]
MKRISTLLLFPLALASTFALAANPDIEAGKAKALVCQACHGTDGNAGVDPQYPRLAGQYADYLARSLHEYKNGGRKNAIMQGFVATLSDEDITNISAYFASLPDARLINLKGRVQGD